MGRETYSCKESLNFNKSEEFPHLFSIISAYNRRQDFAAPWCAYKNRY